jgi:hypothetical protein
MHERVRQLPYAVCDKSPINADETPTGAGRNDCGDLNRSDAPLAPHKFSLVELPPGEGEEREESY